MKTERIIEKYGIRLSRKQVNSDGNPALEATKRAGEKEPTIRDEITAVREKIVAVLLEEAEEAAYQEESRREEYNSKAREYFENADLRRCLVVKTDEWFHKEYVLATLVLKDGKFWLPQFHSSEFCRRTVLLSGRTETLEKIVEERYGVEHGISAMAWEIDDAEEKALVAESEVLRKEKIAAEEKTRREALEKDAKIQAEKAAAIKSRFAEAKETGKPVLLERHSEECSDPNEECDLDVVSTWAMPDGTTKTSRQHTW